MPRPRHLAIVQAGGAGSRMDVLTRERAKPALPFGGAYRLIDITLSNLALSGFSDVWLCLQYQASSLAEQVANGRPWDLDRTYGGLRFVTPQAGGAADGFATGNADLLFRLRDQIREEAPDVVVVLSADHVYTLDISDVVSTHLGAAAECTLVTTRTSTAQATHHLTVTSGTDGRVSTVEYKPESTDEPQICAEIIVYQPAALDEVLGELHSELRPRTDQQDEEDSGLGDFGEHLIPRLVSRGLTVVHEMTGYWKDVGRPETYLQAHRDLVLGELTLTTPEWPIRSSTPQGPPARVSGSARIEDSLLCDGSHVAGTVRRSVIGSGASVEAGAEVCDSVLFGDVVVRSGATVRWSVLDTRVEVGRGATVGGSPPRLPAGDDDITLLGRDVAVPAGGVLPRGSRVEPGSTRV